MKGILMLKTIYMRSFVPVFLFLLTLMLVVSPGFTAGKAKGPSASSPPAKMTIDEEGTAVFNTTVLIKSHKPYWWIKTAGVKEAPGQRVCREDKSKNKKK